MERGDEVLLVEKGEKKKKFQNDEQGRKCTVQRRRGRKECGKKKVKSLVRREGMNRVTSVRGCLGEK